MRVIRAGWTWHEDPAESNLCSLKHALQLLAADARDQVDHFLPPGFHAATFEMASDFDFRWGIVDRFHPLPPDQSARIRAVDDYLREVSGPDSGEFWMNEGLPADPRWEHVRALAKLALESIGWPAEVPPRERYADDPNPPGAIPTNFRSASSAPDD